MTSNLQNILSPENTQTKTFQSSYFRVKGNTKRNYKISTKRSHKALTKLPVCAQILVSKYHSLLKEAWLFGDMVDSQTGARKVQDEPKT